MGTPTLKEVILPQHRRADGSYSVKIRLTHNRGVKYLPTMEVAKVGDYDKRLKITSRSILRRLLDQMDEIDAVIKKVNIFRLQSMDVHELADYINKELSRKEVFKLDFIDFAYKFISGKKKGSANNYRTAINSFKAFMNCEALDISMITSSLMRKYEAHLVQKHGKDARAISLYTSSIGAIHAKARAMYNDNECGDVYIRNPFEFYTPPKQKPAPKRTLEKETIQKLIDIRTSLQGSQRFAVDMFLLSFCLMGTNVPDLYYATMRDDNTIHYNRTKTKDRRYDKAEMLIRVEDVARVLFQEYKDTGKDRTFNLYQIYSSYITIGRICNSGLKEVAKKINVKPFTMYAARHTWATLAYEIGIPMDIINDCLCHVDVKMAVTNIYIRKDWERLWEANRKVLGEFRWE